MDLELSNVIDISVSQPGAGIGAYNTSNLAIFTGETPGGGFGSLGYKIYLEPLEVGVDFGTGSETYKQALSVFSQQPNILANQGYLVVIPLLSGPETLAAAIARTKDLVQYFALIPAYMISQSDALAAAAVAQALNKILLVVSATPGDLASGAYLDLIRTGGFTHTRGIYYGGSVTDPLVMLAAYAGRAFSTNFSGSNTTQTMHLKDLSAVQPDNSMTQTLLNEAKLAGADVYASFQGVAKTFTSGANDFFDNVYNLQWFIGALQVAGFNLLAQLATKLPQTEAGMDSLKNAYRQVCEQAVSNQFSAPGAWNSPTFFGVQQDLIANVAQRGYYIYSIPVAQQSPVDRAARKAPLIQIALKYAGAIHSSTVIVNVNA